MRVLVTGAAGFIGSHLCEALLSRGDSVVGLDNFNDFYDPAIKRANLHRCLADDCFQLVQADITDRQRIDELFGEGQFHAVVHLAAWAGVRPSIQQPRLYQQVNIEGTLNLLEAYRSHGNKRFVFASSSSVYGNRTQGPFRETDSVDNPISPYAATKKAGELLCYTYHHLHGMDISCLRFFTVYGSRQRPEMAIHKFSRLIEEGQPVPMFGDGTSRRDYTHVDDIIQGTVAALDRLSGYNIYNLGGSQTIALKDLIEAIGQALGKEPQIDQQPAQPGDVAVTFADISRAAKDLDYRPQFPLQEGLARFVQWFRAMRENA